MFIKIFPLFIITEKYGCAKCNLLSEHQCNFRIKMDYERPECWCKLFHDNNLSVVDTKNGLRKSFQFLDIKT